MFGNLRPSADQTAALGRIEAWTRARFGLSSDEVVLVGELACALPGCPPLETVIAFWTLDLNGATLRHQLKVFKPALQVVPEDLPPYWMKPALAVPSDYGFDCC